MFQYIEVFNKKITSYSILFLIGLFISGIILFKNAKKNKYDTNELLTLLCISFVGVYVGSHILYGIVNYNLFIIFITHLHNIKNISTLIDCLYEIFGGSVFYGGLLGGLLTGYIYCKRKKLEIKKYSNLLAPFIPLFHAFGRIGCFLMGCCYGIESKIGIWYPIHNEGSIIYKNIFPVQLVESLCDLILFTILYKLYKKQKQNLMSIYLISYSSIRFVLEFLRGDVARGFIFGISTSQLISIVIFIVTVIYLIIKNKKQEIKN